MSIKNCHKFFLMFGLINDDGSRVARMNCILYCTAGVLVDEADYCFSSLMFTTGAAALTALLLLSGGALTLLCARLRRARGKEEQAEHAVHTVHTAAHSLRYSVPAQNH